MKIRIRPSLYVDPDQGKPYPLEKALGLLPEIESTGILRAASAAVSVCYRSAWNLLRKLEKILGGSVVDMTSGKGSSLTGCRKCPTPTQRLSSAGVANDTGHVGMFTLRHAQMSPGADSRSVDAMVSAWGLLASLAGTTRRALSGALNRHPPSTPRSDAWS